MEFNCEHCNKSYKSYQSRWNHVNRYHNNTTLKKSSETSNITSKMPQNSTTLVKNKLSCSFCGKQLSRLDNLKRHEQKCKDKLNENKVSNKNLEIIIEKQSKELAELKELIQKSLKIHPKTLQKINSQLGNIVNGDVNNNIVIQVGNEDFNKVLTENEKLYLLNKYANSVVEMVKMVHISDDEKYKQYKSMYITNLQNNVAYRYDEESKKFIAVTKNELLDSIIENRLADIENFHTDYKEKITPFTSKQITKFIERMNNEKDYKDVKKEQIKFAIYNGREEIIQQIKEHNPDLNIFT
jgi:hypothetical protein